MAPAQTAAAALASRPQLFVLAGGLGDGFWRSLVPGAVCLQLGATGDGGAVINPWDVDDVRRVPDAKIAFLLRLHGLLIGDHEGAAGALALSPLERELLESAVRAVYAHAAAGTGQPREGRLRTVLSDVARREREHLHGSRVRAVLCDGLAERLREVCAEGRFGWLLDAPTRLRAEGAPFVVLDTSAVPQDVRAAVMLTIVEHVSARIARAPRSHISLLADVVDPPAGHGAEQLPAVFAPESMLNGLHERYLRRRVRAGEPTAIAYLHAISDVAHFLHPPLALSDHE